MAKLYVNPNVKSDKINAEIYGHFSEHLGRCIYEGLYVGEDSPIPNTNGMRNDVVAALKEMKIPVLRWPGGCFADEYHWEDGIGPKENRKKMINTHWGGVVEDNSFGTHEFMELARQLGCKVYINGNLGSGTVREMSEWVEYMTFKGVSPMADLRAKNGHPDPWKIDYFGVGNENWGCGGNMTPEFYANEYRRYQTYVRNYVKINKDDDEETVRKKKIFKIACGPNVDDYKWTEGVMKVAGRFMDGLSLHYYVHPLGWEEKGSSTEFDEDEYYLTMYKAAFIDELIRNHEAIMDRYDRKKKVALIVDEWGSWYTVEPGTEEGFLYQQNTMRDALIAGVTLNIFNKHCDRVKMANIAQLVNVLQSVILTEGSKMILTPTYHIFNMYKDHQEAQLVQSSIETEQLPVNKKLLLKTTREWHREGRPAKSYSVAALSESASVNADGTLTVTLTNLSLDTAYPIDAVITDTEIHSVNAEILTNEVHAHNTFEEPDTVKPAVFTAFTVKDNTVSFQMPPCSILKLSIR